MLDQVLTTFEIKPDYDLNIMQQGQTLTDITTRAIQGLEDVIKRKSLILFWFMEIHQQHLLEHLQLFIIKLI